MKLVRMTETKSSDFIRHLFQNHVAQSGTVLPEISSKHSIRQSQSSTIRALEPIFQTCNIHKSYLYLVDKYKYLNYISIHSF